MRWLIFAILGTLLVTLGATLVFYAQSIPVYYAGGGSGVSMTGKVVGGLAPDSCEIPVITVPTTIHIRAKSIEPASVLIEAPNGTSVAQWQNETVNVDFTVEKCGFWNVYISQPSRYFVYGEVFATAPLYAHPILTYAAVPILLGTMSLFHSNYKRKQASRFLGDVHFEQNIGGRWVFLAWIPILAIISQAPLYIPSFPLLYALLLMVTVAAVFFSFALAYVKIYLTDKNVYVEVPFLNFHGYFETQQIYGYTITQENKQRLLGFWKIPSRHPKKEDEVTLFVLRPLPIRIWITSFATRLHSDKIIFRPKSTEKFMDAAQKLGLVKKEASSL